MGAGAGPSRNGPHNGGRASKRDEETEIAKESDQRREREREGTSERGFMVKSMVRGTRKGETDHFIDAEDEQRPRDQHDDDRWRERHLRPLLTQGPSKVRPFESKALRN